jgi:hypothetical protein
VFRRFSRRDAVKVPAAFAAAIALPIVPPRPCYTGMDSWTRSARARLLSAARSGPKCTWCTRNCLPHVLDAPRSPRPVPNPIDFQSGHPWSLNDDRAHDPGHAVHFHKLRHP